MMSFSISYPDVIKFHYFADLTQRGVWGVKGWLYWACQKASSRLLRHKSSHFFLVEHPHRRSVREPAKLFLTSNFSYLILCNPTHKSEMRTANWWELLIVNHLDQSLWLGNQKQGATVISYLLHSSLASRSTALLRCFLTSLSAN